MAKVIKPGDPEKSKWKHRVTCTGKGNTGDGCGAVLEVEESDLFRTESHARNETTRYVTFQCPTCSTWTDLQSDFPGAEKPVPDYIARRIPYRSPDTEPRKTR